MSYLYEKLIVREKNAMITEWTQSSTQTLNSGDKIIFDIARSTGSSGLSIDASGDISIASNKSYWLVMSVDVSRSDTAASFSFGFYNQAGVLLGASDGASESSWGVGLSANNASLTCQAVLTDSSQSFSIRCSVSSGTLTTDTPSLMVMEV